MLTKRLRVVKYMKSSNVDFTSICKDEDKLITEAKKFPTMKSLDADKKANKASESKAVENCDQIATVEEKIDFSNVKIELLFEEEVDFDTFSKSDFRAVKVKECVAVPKSKKHRFTKMTGYTSFSQNHIKQ